MADYNLSGLSTRSFEQLIQALAARVIGASIIIFGDGPDGGREATFDGPIPYPNESSPWNGYGIVQAKFLQRPTNSKRDAAWLIQQLKGEMAKFVDKKRKLRKPDYYLLATNITLSAVANRGSKDTIANLLKDYSTQIGIKDFAVWDYDKIRVLLDNNRDVATAYAAWITAGDVLAQIFDLLKAIHPKFEQVITNFLQKELISEQFARLEQAGHTAETPVPLAAVFTDLPAYNERVYEPKSEDRLAEGFIAEILEVATSRFDPESRRAIRPSTNVAERGTHSGHYVLIGGPGQGKTTIGQYICQLFRSAILAQRPRLAPDAKRAIDQIKLQCTHDNYRLPGIRRFPLRIVLSEFAKAIASPTSGVISLLSYIAQRMSQISDYTVTADSLRLWLSLYPWLVILDGLDEVPASSNRDQILAAIANFWVDCSDMSADVLVIATTRPQGYGYEFSPEFYTHRYLAPLSVFRALHYGQRLVSVRYLGDPERQQKIIGRLRRASSEATTARLMRSPLQVTIMATLVDKLGQPPEERWTLFRDYYKVIYDREVERDIPAANILRRYRSDIDVIHYQTGLVLQIESERRGKTDAKLTEQQFARLVTSHLTHEGHQGKELKTLATSIITAAAQRLVFLVGLEADQVGFEIRSLQEFMAAEGLMQGSDAVVTERLRLIASLVNWRPVFLFAAGRCYADRKHLRDTIYSIAAQLNEASAGEEFSAVRAGSQLALDILEDGSARTQPKHSQTLARLACRIMDLPPAEAQVRLANMYQVNLEPIYKEEIESRAFGTNTHARSAAWLSTVQLDYLQIAWAKKLILKATKENSADLLRATVFSAASEALGTKLTDNIPYCPPRLIEEVLESGHDQWWWPRMRKPWSRAVRQLLGFTARPAVRQIPVILDHDTIVLTTFYRPLRPNWLRGLQKLGDAHHYWEPYLATAKFLSSPSKETLSSALLGLAEVLPIVPQHQMPWPVAACMAWAQNAEEMRKLAQAAHDGKCGDADDWLIAEERWGKGVRLGEFFETENGSVPFDQGIRERGFPAAGHWGVDVSPGNLQRLIPYVISQAPSRRTAMVAQRILQIGYGSPVSLTQDQLRQLMLTSAYSWGTDLDDLAKITHFDEQWAAALDQIGREAEWIYGGGRLSETASRAVLDAYVTQPQKIGLLRILAQLPNASIDTLPSALTEYENFKDDRIRNAALLIRLANSRISDCEISEFCRLACIGQNNSLHHANSFFISGIGTLRRKTELSVALSALLTIKSHFLCCEDHYSMIIAAITDVLRKRRSTLSDPVICQQLELQVCSAHLE